MNMMATYNNVCTQVRTTVDNSGTMVKSSTTKQQKMVGHTITSQKFLNLPIKISGLQRKGEASVQGAYALVWAYRTFSNHIITEIARCVEFFHMSWGWFDCTCRFGKSNHPELYTPCYLCDDVVREEV